METTELLEVTKLLIHFYDGEITSTELESCLAEFPKEIWDSLPGPAHINDRCLKNRVLFLIEKNKKGETFEIKDTCEVTMNPLDTHLEAYQGKYIYEFDNQIQMNWYPGRITTFSDPESSVLELGLGHGVSTNIFSNYFKKYKVIEASPAVIDNFRKQFSQCKANVVESYFEDFESKEKFDIIILGFIMEHVDDPDLILEKYKKFLSPQGRVFISVPNAEVMNRRLGKYAGDLPNIFLLSEHDKICGHKRYYTVRTLSEQIIRHGYNITRTEGIYLKPLSTKQMISLDLQPKYTAALCELGVHYPELCCGILVEFTI